MKALDELRERFAGHFDDCYSGDDRDRFFAACDAIEAELAEEYMALPIDLEGKPIHVGDTMIDWKTPRAVAAVSEDSICLAGYEADSYYRMGIARNYRHHHEPTVKSVLAEMLAEWGELPSEEPIDGIIDKYSELLRLKEGE